VSDAPAADARAILLAAIRAADPVTLTRDALRDWSQGLAPRSVDVIAVGKAAAGMLRGAAGALGGSLRGGVAIASHAAFAAPNGVTVFTGGHPMPTLEGARGAEAIVGLLENREKGTRLLVLLSGGASAMMTSPADGLTVDDVAATSRALMDAGADIRELNCVRKHLDRLKGGLMARIAGGVPIRALVLSDVIGAPLDVIASGPLVADPTTYREAVAILKRRGVWESLPGAVRAHLFEGERGALDETPKPADGCFALVESTIIGNNALAVEGAAAEARARGFEVEISTEPVAGEARVAGSNFARRMLESASGAAPLRPRCIVAGGETTVTIAGGGTGGRNLEFAAAAALVIDGVSGVAVGSIGTDGRDGPTDAAGAVVDGGTALRARAASAEIGVCLANNDTLRALDAGHAVIRTGLTGTNVMDVQVGVATASYIGTKP
jgi:glycerate 2-kinase